MAELLQDFRSIPFIRSRRARGPLSNDSRGMLLARCVPHPPGHLPGEFTLPVRDDAMAPLLTPGDLAIFSTTLKPSPGHCVLLGTEFGPDIRQYEPISASHWVGCSLSPDYEDISTEEEQVWVIAVLIGVIGRAEVPHA